MASSSPQNTRADLLSRAIPAAIGDLERPRCSIPVTARDVSYEGMGWLNDFVLQGGGAVLMHAVRLGVRLHQ